MEQVLFSEVEPASRGRQTRRFWDIPLTEGLKGKPRPCVAPTLGLLLVAATIQKEHSGIPRELNGPAIALMGIASFFLARGAPLRFWILPLILPMTGFVLAGDVSRETNGGDLTSIVRSGTLQIHACLA